MSNTNLHISKYKLYMLGKSLQDHIWTWHAGPIWGGPATVHHPLWVLTLRPLSSPLQLPQHTVLPLRPSDHCPGCFVPGHFPTPPASPQSAAPHWLTPTHSPRGDLPKLGAWLRCALPGLTQDLSCYTARVPSSQNPSHYNISSQEKPCGTHE